MRNPLRVYRAWISKTRWVRIRDKGMWYIFLHSLLGGLLWSIFWTVAMAAVFFMRGRFQTEDWLTLVLLGLVGGLVMALVTWVVNVNKSRYEKMKELQSKHEL